MKRMAFAVVALVVSYAAPARADTLPLINDLPASYTPGVAFTFNLRVPALNDFTSYSLELVFTTEPINPPLFASGSAAATNYVYPSSAGFQSTLTTFADANVVVLTIADSTAPGVAVTPGANDRLATITVTPGADLTGSIQLSIGVDSLFVHSSEDPNYPLLADLPPITQNDPVAPVPAPASAALFAVGALALWARRARG
ncbi:MAG: hypothetical protein FJ304_02285 [Planctomycetes bacterium]|nr:hypothetical protein [Planctomycetota bacterium]